MKIAILLMGLTLTAGCFAMNADENEECGASALQHLVGKPLSEIKTMTFPGKTRIIEPGMGVTKDLRLNRLNIYIDRDDKVAFVRCG